MLRIYETDCAALAPYWDKALALLPPERRQRVQLCRDRAAALGIAAGGLLLRAVLGVRTDGRLVNCLLYTSRNTSSSDWSPLTSSIVPEAMRRPPLMMATLSQSFSATSSTCVEKKIAPPRSQCSRIMVLS